MPKLIVGLSLATTITFTPNNQALALIIQCQTLQQCTRNDLVGTTYCCKTGQTGTTYNCPTNWFWNTANSRCERTSTSGTDTRGTYTQSYGTCDATSTTTYACYDVSNSPTDVNGDSCYTVSQDNIIS